MGLFDTIQLKTPLRCPTCGAETFELQTHHLGETMSEFRIGSVLTDTPVLSGILKEQLWCDTCHKAKKPGDSPVFLVIWHSVLAGVEQDPEKAAARLASVDRLDLISWLDHAQRKERKWKRDFHHLHNDVRKWHEHLAEKENPASEEAGEDEETKKRRGAFRRLWGLEEEILKAPDPLGALIEKHKPKKDQAEDDAPVFGW